MQIIKLAGPEEFSPSASAAKMATTPTEKAEKLRDFAAKGNLEGVETMVRDSLDDIIWWINEGNNVLPAPPHLRSIVLPLPSTPSGPPRMTLLRRSSADSVERRRCSLLRCGGTWTCAGPCWLPGPTRTSRATCAAFATRSIHAQHRRAWARACAVWCILPAADPARRVCW